MHKSLTRLAGHQLPALFKDIMFQDLLVIRSSKYQMCKCRSSSDCQLCGDTLVGAISNLDWKAANDGAQKFHWIMMKNSHICLILHSGRVQLA
jgi:hypothetical protein